RLDVADADYGNHRVVGVGGAVCPLAIEMDIRPGTRARAAAVCALRDQWQNRFADGDRAAWRRLYVGDHHRAGLSGGTRGFRLARSRASLDVVDDFRPRKSHWLPRH